MPKVDLSHFDPNKTTALKVNVYKPEGISFFWNLFSKNKNKDLDAQNKIPFSFKLNLDDVERIKMNHILKKVQNLDDNYKKKLPNFDDIVRIQKHDINLTKNHIFKDKTSKSPHIKKLKQLKPNFTYSYGKGVLSSSSVSITSKKSTVTTNMKYKFIQTTKLKKTFQSSQTSLRVQKSSDTLLDVQTSPLDQNILLKSVPSTIRKSNIQKKVFIPVYVGKNKPIKMFQSQKAKPFDIPDDKKNQKEETNVLPMLMTKIKSMEEQIVGIENTTKKIKEVVSERNISKVVDSKLKSTQSKSIVSHKIYSKNINNPRKNKKSKSKKLNTKSKTIISKKQGFKFNYPKIPEFHFNSCSETSNENKTIANNCTTSEFKNIQSTPQILINQPIGRRLPNNDSCLPTTNNEYSFLLDIIQTLSEAKTPKIDIPNNYFPPMSEVELQTIKSQEVLCLNEKPDKLESNQSVFKLIERKPTEKDFNQQKIQNEPVLGLMESVPTELKNKTDTPDNIEPDLILIENESREIEENSNLSETNSTGNTIQDMQKSINVAEQDSATSTDEHSKILLEILNSQKHQTIIINKLFEKVFNAAPVELEEVENKTEGNCEIKSTTQVNDPDISSTIIASDKESNADLETQAVDDSESVSVCNHESDELDQDCLVDKKSSEDFCEVENPSGESEISQKSDVLVTCTEISSSLNNSPKNHINILVQESTKGEVKTLIEVDQSQTEGSCTSLPCGEAQGDCATCCEKPISRKNNSLLININNIRKGKKQPHTMSFEGLEDIKHLYNTPKQNFYTQIESIKEANILQNYSVEEQGTYLNYEQRKAFEEKVQATRKNQNMLQAFCRNQNTIPLAIDLSISDGVEPYEQFIETSFVSQQTSYSTTKFNVSQENDITYNSPFLQQSKFHENTNFPAIECVTSENKVDVTAKYTSKQHIIHHRKNDLSRYGNFENCGDRLKMFKNGNKCKDLNESRRRTCRFNLTLQQDPILEEIEENISLKKLNFNEVQAEKGDCLIVQANYDNTINSYQSIVNHLEDDYKVNSVLDGTDENQHSTIAVAMCPETISTTVQTDWSISEGPVVDVKAISNFECSENENQKFITTETVGVSDLIIESPNEINALNSKISGQEISSLISSAVNDKDVFREPEQKSTDQTNALPNEMNALNSKISSDQISSTVNDKEVLQESEQKLKKKDGDVEDLLTIKILKVSNQIKIAGIYIGIIQDIDKSRSETKIHSEINSLQNMNFKRLPQLLELNQNNDTQNQDFVMPIKDYCSNQLNERSDLVLTHEDKHCCTNRCLTTVSEETVQSNSTESSDYQLTQIENMPNQNEIVQYLWTDTSSTNDNPVRETRWPVYNTEYDTTIKISENDLSSWE